MRMKSTMFSGTQHHVLRNRAQRSQERSTKCSKEGSESGVHLLHGVSAQIFLPRYFDALS